MFTIYDDKVYKVNGKKMVGVDVTPTSLKTVSGTQIDTPTNIRVLTLNEIKIKYQIKLGGEYKFPKSIEKKVDANESTTKTKKATGKSK